MTPEQEVIFSEISRERDAQDVQWGGQDHDDGHTRLDWFGFIRYQSLRAMASKEQDQLRWPIKARIDFEDRMLKIAAIAVAAIESSRRKGRTQ